MEVVSFSISVSFPWSAEGVAVPEFDWGVDEEVEGVGAIPRISAMWASDLLEMVLAAIARAR